MNRETELRSDDNFVEQLQKDRNGAIVRLYEMHRADFFKFAHQFDQREENKADAFQEGIIALYEYCLAGKFDATRASLKTLLFTMAKYALFKIIKKQTKFTIELDPDDESTTVFVEELFKEELSASQELLKKGLKTLGEQCQKIIRLFYLFEFSIEAIVEEMGYENANVVRSHKSRCLKRLRTFVGAK